MSQPSQVLEGLWEDVVRHADRFTGKQVRVTILGDATETLPSLEEQERLLDELARRHAHVLPLPEEAFGRTSFYADHD